MGEASTAAATPHPLVGTWRIESTSDEIQGGDTKVQALQGFFIFTPGSRVAVLYGSAEEGDGGYKIAWSGTWSAEGDSVEINVDFSTTKFITGKFTRYFQIDGVNLTLKTAVHESKASPGVMKITYFRGVRDAG